MNLGNWIFGADPPRSRRSWRFMLLHNEQENKVTLLTLDRQTLYQILLCQSNCQA